jgi:hypothetical protein
VKERESEGEERERERERDSCDVQLPTVYSLRAHHTSCRVHL